MMFVIHSSPEGTRVLPVSAGDPGPCGRFQVQVEELQAWNAHLLALAWKMATLCTLAQDMSPCYGKMGMGGPPQDSTTMNLDASQVPFFRNRQNPFVGAWELIIK